MWHYKYDCDPLTVLSTLNTSCSVLSNASILTQSRVVPSFWKSVWWLLWRTGASHTIWYCWKWFAAGWYIETSSGDGVGVKFPPVSTTISPTGFLWGCGFVIFCKICFPLSIYWDPRSESNLMEVEALPGAANWYASCQPLSSNHLPFTEPSGATGSNLQIQIRSMTYTIWIGHWNQ